MLRDHLEPQDPGAQVAVAEAPEGGEAWLRTLFEALPDAVVTVDPEGRIQALNPATEAMFGYRAGQLTGRPLADLVHPAPDQALGEGPQNLAGRRRDGSSVPLSAILRETGAGWSLVILRDRTDTDRLEEAFWEAQRLEPTSRLAEATVDAYDSLLLGIHCCCNLALGALDAGRSAEDPLHAIERGTRRGHDLRHQLSDPIEAQPNGLADLDLDEWLRAAEPALQAFIGPDLGLVLRLGAAPQRVVADRAYLRQIVLNLVSNAADATAREGRIALSTRVLRIAHGDARHRGGQPVGRWERLRVTDNGAGMDQQTQRRAFEPLFTTKAADRGTGLGLPAVRGILGRLGGHVHLTSAPGEGTTVDLLFRPSEGDPQSS